MGTLGQAPGMTGGILHVKGAPEIILARCQDQLTIHGKQSLTDEQRLQIDHELKTYQLRGMRTLGLAYHDGLTAKLDTNTQLEEVAHNLTWLGFFVIHDPIRPEVPAAIADCAKAGVAVKMVTGDNPATAREIARQIGLWSEVDDHQPSRLLTGPEFAALDDIAAEQAVGQVKVMARARPLDKLRLVRLLKQRGEVVAVTGDGTNDAPAMNFADVGLAMGETGTAVAKGKPATSSCSMIRSRALSAPSVGAVTLSEHPEVHPVSDDDQPVGAHSRPDRSLRHGWQHAIDRDATALGQFDYGYLRRPGIGD